MANNHMEEVAQILGLQLGQHFRIKEFIFDLYRISENGLEIFGGAMLATRTLRTLMILNGLVSVDKDLVTYCEGYILSLTAMYLMMATSTLSQDLPTKHCSAVIYGMAMKMISIVFIWESYADTRRKPLRLQSKCRR